MFSNTTSSVDYQKLSEEELVDGTIPAREKNGAERRNLSRFAPWILVVIVTVVYVSHWYINLRHSETSPCFNERLLDAPIIWEEKTYMSNIDGDIEDPYSIQSPNVEAAWLGVRYEEVTAITDEENARLPGHVTSAKLYGGENGHAVLLEVFHQIHCLDAIRRAYFKVGNWTHDEADFKGSNSHVDHCFSYLLQSLLCHGDVGVMTTRWVDSLQDFAANFNVTRQCRNFEAIRSWAEGRKAQHDTPTETERKLAKGDLST